MKLLKRKILMFRYICCRSGYTQRLKREAFPHVFFLQDQSSVSAAVFCFHSFDHKCSSAKQIRLMGE